MQYVAPSSSHRTLCEHIGHSVHAIRVHLSDTVDSGANSVSWPIYLAYYVYVDTRKFLTTLSNNNKKLQ